MAGIRLGDLADRRGPRRDAAARPRATWPQIGAGRKTLLPNEWSQCQWVSTTIETGSRGELAQLVDDHAGLRRGRSRVDEQDVAAPEHDADLLIEEIEVPGEDAIADLEPVHRRASYRVPRGGVGSRA